MASRIVRQKLLWRAQRPQASMRRLLLFRLVLLIRSPDWPRPLLVPGSRCTVTLMVLADIKFDVSADTSFNNVSADTSFSNVSADTSFSNVLADTKFDVSADTKFDVSHG